MKTAGFRPVLFFGILAIFGLTGCNTVTVKKPAGDKVATLDPKIWEGTWVGPDGFRGTSRIKDASKGLVEFRSLAPGEKKDSATLIIRELKDRLVGTAYGEGSKESAAFLRVSATEHHLALFLPNHKLFKEAVASGKIAGEMKKSGFVQAAPSKDQPDNNHKPEPQGGVMIDLPQFGAAEVDRMPLHDAGNAAECFETDPDLVLVKEKKTDAVKKTRAKK